MDNPHAQIVKPNHNLGLGYTRTLRGNHATGLNVYYRSGKYFNQGIPWQSSGGLPITGEPQLPLLERAKNNDIEPMNLSFGLSLERKF
ncbi:MAG: hypothetical protein KF870_07240 [Leadbetterella sp.]|nr:hypothetical protein [Leadbetterella sp.]